MQFDEDFLQPGNSALVNLIVADIVDESNSSNTMENITLVVFVVSKLNFFEMVSLLNV